MEESGRYNLMTVYGFDLDGTLTRPEIRNLANDLFAAGHKVYVITGGLSDTGEWTKEARVKYLKHLGVNYTDIIRCLHPTWEGIAEMKGQACKRLGVQVMLDDMPVFLNGIRAVCPSAALLLVV
jgi:hypothetical protein